MSEITIHELTTGYGRRIVTRGVTATLRSGQLTCLMGPNGSGKSTLLRTLSGFMPPLSGSVEIDGVDMARMPPRQMAQTISVVLTERLSMANMTVDELVAMGRSPYTGFWGGMDAEDRRIVDRAIDMVGVRPLVGRRVDSLSDGECQKVMIAKSLAQQTPVIFLDEPTAFLDYPSKVDTLRLLHDIARDSDRIIFMSTHDLELTLQVADMIWLMDGGHINIGTPEDLAYTGRLADCFDSPSLVFNHATGSFDVSIPTRRELTVSGDGLLAQMVRRALRRTGIKPVDVQGRMAQVMVEDGTIVYGGEAQGSIGELIDRVGTAD